MKFRVFAVACLFILGAWVHSARAQHPQSLTIAKKLYRQHRLNWPEEDKQFLELVFSRMDLVDLAYLRSRPCFRVASTAAAYDPRVGFPVTSIPCLLQSIAAKRDGFITLDTLMQVRDILQDTYRSQGDRGFHGPELERVVGSLIEILGDFPRAKWGYVHLIQPFIDAFFLEMKRQGKTGGFFDIYANTGETPIHSIFRTMEIPVAAGESISRLFQRSEKPTLTNYGKGLLSSGKLDESEAAELYALSRSIPMVVMSTPIKDDYAGWFGNYCVGALANQTKCYDDAMTVFFLTFDFIHAAKVRSFELMGITQRDTDRPALAHNCAFVKNARTGAHFIIDSWLRGPSKAALVMELGDWHAKGSKFDLFE